MVSYDRFGLLKIFGGGSYYNNGIFVKKRYGMISEKLSKNRNF